ncbi:iojap-like protein [Beutenbergia cavernae DSM 12333]|uniref:Ribosomal silencing factor RsfS n=1 Tax=Beutenbergia cavernae (strain ATCC BAA-8 / DSM 12333 / CCUG 43141 / JCM 11478 / NBRC 16432 / NCIMB 13614 / HKI 0122) TaxID=471853 RepID=C5C3Y0_BEUC1|nr:ribosome silencing factor [Beutenbergia cavernae]ACQ79893.1 iojap-like protein [Beutenbergia cavernae DSM 12333]
MPADPHSRHLAVEAARAAADKKAIEIIALDVSERLVLTDVFVVASGANERQVASIVDAVEEAMHREGVRASRKEGVTQARWVLLDYGDIVVHVQHSEDREFYALERLWKDCPVVDLPADLAGPDADAPVDADDPRASA